MASATFDFTFDAPHGAWKVVHAASGSTASLNGVPQCGLTLDAADGMASLLNRVALRP